MTKTEHPASRVTVGPVAPREVMPGLFVSPDADALARAAARYFVEWAWQAIAEDGRFFVALSGGTTPEAFFRVLATQDFRTQVDWGRVEFFWGDERPVPPDSKESNYGNARRELLIRIPIPNENVHRMEADRPNMGRAAQEYEDLLREKLPLDSRGFPRFHLVLLGLGPEGHTASLFPGLRGMRETSRWVSTPLITKLGTRRMTLTLPVLNAAHRAAFMVSGAEKAEILYRLMSRPSDPPLPAQLVTVPDGKRVVLCDEPAAKLILDEISKKGHFVGEHGSKTGQSHPHAKK